jgi:hypothetical protein
VLLCIPIVLVAGCAGIDEMAGLQAYPIRLHRPMNVGRRMHMAVEARSSMITHAYDDTEIVEEAFEEITYNFAGDIAVLAVGTNGLPWKVEIRIEHLTRKEKDKADVILPQGSVVLAWDDGKDLHYKTGGEKAGAGVRRALGLMVVLRRDQTTVDELYPATAPKRVGESWSIDRELAAKEAAENGLTIEPDNITGQATLTAVTGPPGAREMEILSETTSRHAVAAQPGPFGLRRLTHLHRARTRYPLDTEELPKTWSWERTLRFSGRRRRGPDTPILRLECVFSDQVKGTTRALPARP